MYAEPLCAAVRAAREVTMRKSSLRAVLVAGGLAVGLAMFVASQSISRTVSAQPRPSIDCPVTHQDLQEALAAADLADSSGLNNHYWAVAVNREGTVCAVAFSGQL